MIAENFSEYDKYAVNRIGANMEYLLEDHLKLWLDIAPESLQDPFHLARDVRQVGHWGTGDLEVNLKSAGELHAVMALIAQSYQKTR